MFSHSQVSKPRFRISGRIMKAWKSMVKSIKEVPPHLVQEIRWVQKYLVGLSI
jgi:hypothetical protein